MLSPDPLGVPLQASFYIKHVLEFLAETYQPSWSRHWPIISNSFPVQEPEQGFEAGGQNAQSENKQDKEAQGKKNKNGGKPKASGKAKPSKKQRVPRTSKAGAAPTETPAAPASSSKRRKAAWAHRDWLVGDLVENIYEQAVLGMSHAF